MCRVGALVRTDPQTGRRSSTFDFANARFAMTLWERYVTSASRDTALLIERLGDPAIAQAAGPASVAELAHIAFRLALSSLAIGAEDVGRLALAAERALDRASSLDATAWTALGQAIGTLG